MKAVLVVDDEKMTLKMISNIITKAGFFPILASDGERAFQVLSDNPSIVAILTDYQMPNLNGLEFLEKLKDSGRFEGIPVLVFSAYIGLREVESVLEKGATYFMPKPVHKVDIEEFLKRYAS